MKKIFTLLISLMLLWTGSSWAQNLSEGFNGTVFPPTGWTVINGGDANTWVRSTSAPRSGAGHASIIYGATAHSDYLISPQLAPVTGNATYSFWARNYSSSYIDRFDVKLSTTGTATGDFTVTLASQIGPPTTYTQYSYDLSAYAGQHVYVAIIATSTDMYYLYIDDVAGPPIYTVTPFLATAPSTNSFGYISYGNSSSSQYTLSGGNLTAGPIIVTAPSAEFQVSTDNVNWYSTVNVSYTPPTLANTVVYTKFTPSAAGASYSGNITNVGGGATTNVAVSGSSDLFSLYCSSIPSNTADEEIYSVTVNGATTPAAYAGTNGCSTAAPGAGSLLNKYSNFRSLGSFTNLARTTSIAFTVVENECDGSSYYSNGCSIWVDWNQDGDWNDSGEQVFVEGTTTTSPRTITGSFSVPAGATLGQTGMRIIVAEGYSGTGLTPCMTYSYGETEDYIVTITEAPACPNPAALLANNVTAHTADLAWTEQGTATSWEVEWGTNGFTQGTGTIINVNTTPTTSLSGLTASTAYAYYVRANCGGTYSPWSGPKTFTTLVSCPAPTALTASAISGTKESLDWTDASGSAWEIEYGPTPFTPTGIATITGITSHPFSITGLTAATTYAYYVRADCSGSGDGYSTWSGPYTFTTLCDIIVPPYTQDFSSYTGAAPNPVCWSEADAGTPATGPSTLGSSLWVSDQFANTGTNTCAKVNMYSNAKQDWLISPQFDLSAGNYRAIFDIARTAWNGTTTITMGSDDQMMFLISPDGGATWSTLRTWDATTPVSNTGETIIVDLSTYTQSDVKFAFWSNEGTVDDTPDYDFFVDNFKVETIPACPYPTAVSASSVTAHSASIAWTPGGSETSWEVEYGLNGFTQGTGTIITPATNPQALTSLVSSTAYAYYVRANCGTGFSPWVGPYTFTTTIACPAPTAGTATNITTTTADLGWTNPGGALWNIEYGVTGFTQGTGTMISGTALNPYSLSGLTSNTTYQFYVQSDCGTDGTSLWGGPFSFTTDCEVLIAPFTETFETGPACWTISGGTYNWGLVSGASGYGNGTYSIRANFYSINSTTPFYIFTPEFDISAMTTPTLKFDFAYATYETEVDQMDVEYSTDGGATFTLLKSYIGGTSGNMVTAAATTTGFVPTSGQWLSDSLTLPAGTNRVAFKAISAYGNNLYVDNVKVYEPITTKTLNVKAYIQGLYNSGLSMMTETNDDTFAPKFGTGIADTVTVQLHNNADFTVVEARYPGVQLLTNGNMVINSVDGSLSGNYYITVFPRNAIPVTTASPVSFAGSVINYDFTTAAAQAYGTDAQAQVDAGVYALYSGELDHDAFYFVDLSDLPFEEVDVELGSLGYIITDIDGNGWVDLSDLSFIEANMVLGPYFQNPLFKKRPTINK
jgi:hypothetical protein